MNPYDVLGVKEGVSKAELKKIYRKLANRYHPDRNREAGAEERFKLIKDAYEFISTGKSDTQNFVEPKVVRRPRAKPQPQPDPTVWATGYGALHVQEISLLITFADAMAGSRIKIPHTHFTLGIPRGVQNGFKERRLCESAKDGTKQYFDVTYHLVDPSGFYKLQDLRGAMRFCCHVEVTASQLLAGSRITFRNADPGLDPIVLEIPIHFKDFVVVKGQGMGIDRDGRRGDLCVIPLVKVVAIEDEIFPTLKDLDRKVTEALRAYKYFK